MKMSTMNDVSERYHEVRKEEFMLSDPAGTREPAFCQIVIHEQLIPRTTEPSFVELYKEIDGEFTLVDAFSHSHPGYEELLSYAVTTYGEDLLDA
jgi:hypothetical protein